MWIVFSVISLLCYATSDLIGKKHADNGDSLASFKLIASTDFMAFAVGMILFGAGVGESGLAPWQLLINYPLIAVNVMCLVLHWTFFLFSLRYIGLSMDEAVQSTYGVFYFIGLVAVNLFSGKLSAVGEMLTSLRLVPIILVLVFTLLLPNTEVIAQRKKKNKGTSLVRARADRKNIITAMVLLVGATVFDSLDSLVATVILEDGGIGTFDFMMTSYFGHIIPAVMLYAFVVIKGKRKFIPFVSCGKYSVIYALCAMFSSVFYLISSSFDAVRTGILFIAYPVVPIIGAKLFLKEKYTVRQNICIWAITLSAMAFCIADSLL